MLFFICERLKNAFLLAPAALGSVLQYIFANVYFRFICLRAEITEDHTIGMLIFLCISRIHLEWQQLTLGEPGLMNDASWKTFQHLSGSSEGNLQKSKNCSESQSNYVHNSRCFIFVLIRSLSPTLQSFMCTL